MRRPPSFTALVLASALAAAGCTRSVPPAATGAASSGRPLALGLVVSASLRGALEPCGCTEAQRGGVARLAHHLAEARRAARPFLYVDGGDTLFASLAQAPDDAPSQRLKARSMARALVAMGLTGHAPGPLDDAHGAPFRARLGLPVLPRLALIPVAGADALRVHSGDDAPRLASSTLIAVLSPAAASELPPLATEARRHGARFVLALVPVGYEALVDADARGLTAGVDLLVATRPEAQDESDTARLAGEARRLVQLPPRGQALLRVELQLAGGVEAAARAGPTRAPPLLRWREGEARRERERVALDERVARLRAELGALGLSPALAALKREKLDALVARRDALLVDDETPPADVDSALLRVQSVEASHPRLASVQAEIDAVNADISRTNAERAAHSPAACPEASPARPAFVGSEACRGCHPAAFPSWEASKHRRAWDALVAAGKQLHLDCIACHVTGWREPGGVCRVDAVQGRAEVGCEACHGPGLPHLVNPVAATTHRPRGPERCLRCHDAENSPRFAFDPAVALLRAPGHGAPRLGDAGVAATPPLRWDAGDSGAHSRELDQHRGEDSPR